MEHKKESSKHCGVKHEGAVDKNSWSGDRQPKSGSRQPKWTPAESGNGPAHMSWKGSKK